jgi:phage/plasmid-associated DNA primase
MSTNHRPEIPDGSEAIWDRLKLIPFTQRFDGAKADPSMPEKLREEMDGIFTWAVRGAVQWFEHGLGTAAAADKATAEYREDTDVMDRFFADMCVFGPDKWITKGDLFEAWESWAIDEGVEPGKQGPFTSVMKERGVVRGFSEQRTKRMRFWQGIDVIKEGGVATPPPGEQTENSVTSDPKSVTSENASPQESPAKHGGVEEKVTQFSEKEISTKGTPSYRDLNEKSENSVIAPPEAGETIEFDGLDV